MNKKIITVIIGVIVIATVLFVVKSKSESAMERGAGSQIAGSQSGGETQSAEKVQVYLFHSTERCPTCIAIGRLAGETVNEFFQTELREGKIEFREINVDLPENEALAEKFQASGSALYINTIVGGKDDIVQDTKVWQLTKDEAKFKSYLKDELDKRFTK